MQKSKAKKIVRRYADELLSSGYPVAQVYLFGSFATSKAGKWSDLDVAIVAKKRMGTLWQNDKFLSKISLKIDSRLEPHGFTVKDFTEDSDPMVHEIKRTGVRIK